MVSPKVAYQCFKMPFPCTSSACFNCLPFSPPLYCNLYICRNVELGWENIFCMKPVKEAKGCAHRRLSVLTRSRTAGGLINLLSNWEGWWVTGWWLVCVCALVGCCHITPTMPGAPRPNPYSPQLPDPPPGPRGRPVLVESSRDGAFRGHNVNCAAPVVLNRGSAPGSITVSWKVEEA